MNNFNPKMNLQELKDKGVKELTVKNGEARAVNPYDGRLIPYAKHSVRNQEPFKESQAIKNFPSVKIPCPSIPDGVYEIDRFEEVPQFKGIYGWEEDCDIPASIQAGLKTRTVLILKSHEAEPVEITVEEVLKKHSGTYPIWRCEKEFIIQAMEEYASLRVQQAHGWISVKDRLPEDNKPVLGLAKFKCVVQYTKGWDLAIEDEDGNGDFNSDSEKGELYMKEGWYEECEQHNGMYDSIFIKRNITHWQPLPEPPK